VLAIMVPTRITSTADRETTVRTSTSMRLALAGALLCAGTGSLAAQSFTIDQVIAPPFPLDLVASPAADRIAWIAYERGTRNVLTAAGPEYEPYRLTANDRDDGVDLSGLQISRDGEILAFLRGHTRNREGWVANPSSDPRGGERAVWAVSSAGGAPWRIVEADAFALSPDGRWIACERDGQLYRAAVNPGASDPVDLDRSPPLFLAFGENGDPVWSPDGTRIAFVSQRGDHSFVGVYDMRAPRITWLSPGVDRDGTPVWSPDGRRIAFVRRPGLPFGAARARPEAAPDSIYPEGLWQSRFRGGHTLELWIANAATGEATRLWHSRPDDTRLTTLGGLHWAGDHLVFEAEPDNWEHWYSISVREPAADPVELTPGIGFVEHVAFSPDGRTLYYTTNIDDIDRRDLWRVPVEGGRPRQLTHGDGIETYPAAPAGGGTIALLYADARQPQSVAVLDADGGTPRVITALPADFPKAAHVVPENVVLTAPDGVQFHNQLFLPADLRPGERRPALVFIHGGPRRQMLLGYHYMHFYHMAYAINQYFAGKGYIALSVNYRSGIGYGREFRTAANVGRNGNAEYQDILAAGQYLRSRPDVDPARVGLWGLSYGGILTAQGLARNSDVFAAGVDIAGVHLWGDTLSLDNVNYTSSSAFAVRDWRSPVLLIHGDDDRNVAFSQTVGLVQLLRANDVPHELIVFPDEVHDFLIHERWLIAFHATDRFFERTLVRGERVQAGGGR
jgi:dipeptidyl aminopeptidase/acylaminoacyl peptidase